VTADILESLRRRCDTLQREIADIDSEITPKKKGT
jgi:hypothetical protein